MNDSSMPPNTERGLTLLELLLVVLILATMATLTVSIVDSSGSQFRYDDTRTRLENVKRGIVGRPIETMNGQPLVSGFVADMGRLPTSIRELIDRELFEGNADRPNQLWKYRKSAGVCAGWQGPYVDPQLEDGIPTYRDGWANSNDAGPKDPFYGWCWPVPQPEADEIHMWSLGSDGESDPPLNSTSNPDPYAADYPPPGYPLVKGTDHLVDVTGLQVLVRFHVLPANTDLRLRVLYPDFEEDPDRFFDWLPSPWPDSDGLDDIPWLSSTGVPTDSQGGDKDSTSTNEAEHWIQFIFSEMEIDNQKVPRMIPWGLRSFTIVQESNGSRVDSTSPKPILLVPRTYLPPQTIVWD